MGGLTRRELLQRSAVAGGVVWAAPLLSSGRAWGTTAGCCACDAGEVIYAKFAPGNSQTCQNQCLQPGSAKRFDFDCLAAAGLIGVCDDVNSNDDTAALAFGTGVTPMKFAIKSESNCYIARCNEGFSVVYSWSTSFNNEQYTGLPGCAGNSQPCVFTDPATSDDDALIQVYSGGTGPVTTRCTGQVGNFRPSGTRTGHTRGLASPCTTPLTGVYLTTVGISDKLNFNIKICFLWCLSICLIFW